MIRYLKVTKIFPNGARALQEVDLGFSEGEFAFVVGPSGAGKSTLLNLLIRQYRPTSGEVWFRDFNVSRLPGRKIHHLRRQIGMVFQDFKLLSQFNVYENVAFTLEAVGKAQREIRELVPYILELVGLADKMNRRPHQLSSGEAQRVSIARAMVHEPAVLLADEPTGNLDPQTGWQIIELLQKINSWGTTVIVATHNREIVDALNYRVVKLKEGKVVADQVGSYE